MVMYISSVSDNTLTLKYDNVPSAKEVIRDILNAPIEYGETFQNKRKGKHGIIVKDERIKVDADLGKKAVIEILTSGDLRNAGFRFATEKNGLDSNYIYVPETPCSEQSSLMG